MAGVSFDILGRDKASQAFDKVGKAADRTEKKFGFLAARSHGLTAGIAAGFGKILPAMAAIASVSVFKGFIDEARESRKVGALTESIIRSTGGAAKISAGQVGDLATAISNKTGVDDEAVQSGANLLLTFKNVRNEVGKGANIFDRATQAAVDLSAAGFGDVNSASKMLGKALNDPLKGLTALGKAGVTFTEDQKKQIKTLVETGDVLSAQKIILKEVESQVGGAAAAASDPMEKLGVIIGNVKETIGGAFLPIVDKAATWLGNVLPGAVATAGKFFNERLMPPLQTVVGFVQDKLVPGIEGLYDLLVKHDFTKEFGKAFSIPEDSNVVTFLLGLNEGVRDATSNAKKWATSIIKGLTDGFKTGDWKPLGTAVGQGFIDGLKGIGSVIDKVGTAVGDLIDKIDWGKVGSNVDHAVRDMLKSVDWKGIGSALGDAVVTLFEKTTDLGQKIHDAFVTLMGKVDWKQIGRDSTVAIGKFIEGIDWGAVAKTLGISAIKSLKLSKSVYDTVIGSMADLVMGMGEEIGKAIGKWFAGAGKWLYNKGKELVKGLFDGASDQTSGVGTWLQAHVITPVVGVFKDTGKWLVTHGKNLIEGLKNGIATAASAVGAWIMRAPVAQVVAPFLGAVKWLIGPGKDVIAGLLNGIGSAAKGVGSWLSRNVISPVTGAFSKAGTWLVQQGKNLLAGFLNGVSAIAKGIGSWISTNVISPVTTAFSKAGTWLVQSGKNLIAGFKNGITNIATTIGRWAYDHVISPVVAPFGKAGEWLVQHGKNLVAGLQVGIDTMIKTIRSWVSDHIGKPIVAAVKWFFGIQSPSKVFAEMGGHMVQGLFKGLASKDVGKAVVKIFGGMPQALGAIVNKGLIAFNKLPKKAIDALGGSVGIGQPLGGPVGNTSNVGIVRTLAGQRGWGTGYQWDALYKLIMGESGFRNTAQNPTSSAYGLFQFLDSTWGSVGARKTSDPWAQTVAGLKYIAGSYGSPAQAYAAWSSRSPHWYEKGTPWVPNDQLAFLHKGEAVIPAPVNRRLRAPGGGETRIVLELRTDGTPHMERLARELRQYIRAVGGGDVQVVLGT